MGNRFLKRLVGFSSLLLAIPLAAQVRRPVPQGMVEIRAGYYRFFLNNKGNDKKLVRSFYLDIHAVTNADFLRFVKANPQWARSRVSRLYADRGYLKDWDSDYSAGKSSKVLLNSPVTNISWFAARAYARWAGKRLPTLDEWEYAAAAAIVNNRLPVEKVILDWYSRPSPQVIPPVGSAFKNKWRVSDMHGLIWEWVEDFNGVIMENDSRSGNLDTGLYCAAGSYGASDKKDYAAFMRFAFRGSLKASYIVHNLGFRCAADIK